MELIRVVQLPARRKAIFADITRPPTPTLTHEIWQELLLHLGRVHYTLVTRGGSRSFSAPAASQAAVTPDPRSISVKQADIFRPVVKQKSSYGLSLLDGPIRAVPPQPVTQLVQATRQIESKAVAQAKQVQNEVVGRIEATPMGHTVLGEADGWTDAVYSWMGLEWAGRSIGQSLPDMDLARLVLDSTLWCVRAEPVLRPDAVFATLAVASTEEDTYGHVQQVLPATLEAIIRFRSSLVSFENELLGQATLLGRAQGAAGNEVKRQLGPAIMGEHLANLPCALESFN